jgi:glycosyltransferase involved in cell wall biosynthesis
MKPLISIITISYQAEAHLRRTMESVLSQDYMNMEYLVVDGASTDQTLSIIREFEQSFQEKGIPFRWISEPDKGIYDAMNKGLGLATGDYVWFMNAGDCISSGECLKTIINSMAVATAEKQEALPDFIYGETNIVDEKGQIMGARRLKAPETLTWKSFRMGMLVCHQSMLVKRQIAPLFDLQYRYSSDFDWTIRCLKKANHIHNCRVVVSHFLDGGVSKKKMKASLKERFHIMARYYGWLPTALRHLWFVCRAFWFKLMHGWI